MEREWKETATHSSKEGEECKEMGPTKHKKGGKREYFQSKEKRERGEGEGVREASCRGNVCCYIFSFRAKEGSWKAKQHSLEEEKKGSSNLRQKGGRRIFQFWRGDSRYLGKRE